MTFEERMDAIAMNLELYGHRLEDSRREWEERHLESRREWQERHLESRHEWEERQRTVAAEMAEFRERMADLRERTDVLLKATTQMLAVADAHDRRIAKLERLSA